jgi:hypothetical protein
MLYAAVNQIEDPLRRRVFRLALIADWAKLDPLGALAFLREKDATDAVQLAREWLRHDPHEAVTGMLAGGEKMHGALRDLLKEIAHRTPTRLAEVLTQLPKIEERREKSALEAFAIFARSDFVAARAAAESLTGPHRGQALAGVARSWAEQDGAAALAWGRAMQAGEIRNEVLRAVLTGWSKADPLAALDYVDLVPPGGNTYEVNFSDVGAQLVAEAARKDWDGTLRWLSEHLGKVGLSGLEGLESVFTHRLQTDVAGTLSALARTPIPGLREVFASSLLNEGYPQHELVWKWAEGQPASEFAHSVRRQVIEAMGWKEPERAVTFLESIPETAENRELLQTGMANILNHGTRTYLLEDLLKNASPKLRPYVIETALVYNQGTLPGGLEKWFVLAGELPPERLDRVYPALSRTWAASDPAAAAKWAQSLTDPRQHTGALSAAVGSWVTSEPFEAAQWIDGLPAGSDRDLGAQSLAAALSKSQPENAWAWAQSIQDKERRREALVTVYCNVDKNEPGTAERLLQKANLSAEDAAILRANVAFRRGGGPLPSSRR